MMRRLDGMFMLLLITWPLKGYTRLDLHLERETNIHLECEVPMVKTA